MRLGIQVYLVCTFSRARITCNHAAEGDTYALRTFRCYTLPRIAVVNSNYGMVYAHERRKFFFTFSSLFAELKLRVFLLVSRKVRSACHLFTNLYLFRAHQLYKNYWKTIIVLALRRTLWLLRISILYYGALIFAKPVKNCLVLVLILLYTLGADKGVCTTKRIL